MIKDNCKAYRELDEMTCPLCGLRWSLGDSERPDCNPPSKAKPSERLRKIREMLRDD